MQELLLTLYGRSQLEPALLRSLLEELGLQIATDVAFVFPNGAVTWAAVLMESHAVLHTYPEHQTAYINLCFCDPAWGPARLQELAMSLATRLEMTLVSAEVITRDVPSAA